MFTGHTALVTGGSRGIGLAIAKRLAQEGATIKLLARDEPLLQLACTQLSTSHNQQHQFMCYNLTELITGQTEDVQKYVGNNTMLVNCAGITTHSLLHQTSPRVTIDTINLNLTIPIILSQMAIKNMIRHRKKNPSILNISSVLSFTDYVVPGTSVYAASKAGLLGFTTSLAHELKGRVRVNSLLPGLVKETNMGANANLDESLRLVSMDSIVQEAIRILGDVSMNGQCVILDEEDKPRLLKSSSLKYSID